MDIRKVTLAEFQQEIQKDPVVFLDSALGCAHWSKQDVIIRSTFHNQRTSVKSCHGIGKTYTASRIAMAFLFAYENSVVITTAPTFRQVENILWREMRSAYKAAKIPLGGNMLKTKFEIDEKWYALGLSSDKEDNFQGFHAKHILVIVDEAGGVNQNTMNVIEALLTSEGGRLLYIGNPTQASGGFYDSHKSEDFNKISISCFDTPNFTKNNIKTIQDLQAMTKEQVRALPLVYPELITPMWVHDRMRNWGVDSAIFQSRVLANFPEEGKDQLIRLGDIERALLKEWTEDEWKMRPRRNAIGIDVARFGEDTTVLIAFDNGKMNEDIISYNGKDTTVTVGHAIAMFNSLGWKKEFDYFVVDDTGVGGGVTDQLVAQGYNVLPINNASSASDPETFRDIKAEICWMLRQAFIDNQIRIYDVERLIKDISSIKYDITPKGQIFIKSKKEMKKAGLDSPDFFDAMALAFYGACILDGGDVVVAGKKEEDDADDFTIVGNVLKKTF